MLQGSERFEALLRQGQMEEKFDWQNRRGFALEAVTDQGTTPLMKAAANGRSSVIKLLLAAGADPSRRNKQGKTALDLARAKGDAATIELLSSAQP